MYSPYAFVTSFLPSSLSPPPFPPLFLLPPLVSWELGLKECVTVPSLYICFSVFFRGHRSRAQTNALTEVPPSGLCAECTSSQNPSLLSSLTLKVGTGDCPMDSLHQALNPVSYQIDGL